MSTNNRYVPPPWGSLHTKFPVLIWDGRGFVEKDSRTIRMNFPFTIAYPFSPFPITFIEDVKQKRGGLRLNSVKPSEFEVFRHYCGEMGFRLEPNHTLGSGWTRNRRGWMVRGTRVVMHPMTDQCSGRADLELEEILYGNSRYSGHGICSDVRTPPWKVTVNIYKTQGEVWCNQRKSYGCRSRFIGLQWTPVRRDPLHPIEAGLRCGTNFGFGRGFKDD